MASGLITTTDKSSGRALALWRNMNQKSRKTVAVELGVSHITVRAWEKAESRPREDRWDQIEKVAGFRWDSPPGESQTLAQAIEKTDGNKAEAAALLGISRQSLGQKLKRHGLFKPVARKHLKGAVPAGKRWRSQGHVGGKTRYLGTFDSEEEAHDAYLAARKTFATPKPKGKEKPVPEERHGIRRGEEFFYVGKNAKYPDQKVEIRGFGRYDSLLIIQLRDPQGRLEGRPFICTTSALHKEKPKEKPVVLWVYTGGRGKGKALNGTLFQVERELSDTHVFAHPVDAKGDPTGKSRRINRRFLASVDQDTPNSAPQEDLNRPDTAEVPLLVPDIMSDFEDEDFNLKTPQDIVARCTRLLGEDEVNLGRVTVLLELAQGLLARDALKLERATKLAHWLQGEEVAL